MPIKRYQIEFFQVTLDPTAAVPDVATGFRSLAPGAPVVSTAAGYTREIWRLAPANGVSILQGQLRKFRMDDFPEVGAIGGNAEELELADDQGIIERNFFRYEFLNDLLVWHSNGHGSTPNQFARVLSDLWGTRVYVSPILQGDAARRLLSGAVDVKRIELSIPVPTNPEYYPANDFSQRVIDMLRGAGGDRIKIVISADARKVGDGQMATLARSLKRSVAELAAHADASVARVEAFEDGVLHPIDLVADRVIDYKDIDQEGRYPTPRRMFEALAEARADVAPQIEEYFGAEDRRINR